HGGEPHRVVDGLPAAARPAMRLAITSVAPTIMRVGTDEQKARWLPKILRGEVDFCVAYSEPNAGTDLAALTTRAELVGHEWVIYRHKISNTAPHTPQRHCV